MQQACVRYVRVQKAVSSNYLVRCIIGLNYSGVTALLSRARKGVRYIYAGMYKVILESTFLSVLVSQFALYWPNLCTL
jgi:hypothetical protein